MNNMTKVKAESYTEEIPTPGGIKQDDSLSPFLFNLFSLSNGATAQIEPWPPLSSASNTVDPTPLSSRF